MTLVPNYFRVKVIKRISGVPGIEDVVLDDSSAGKLEWCLGFKKFAACKK